MTDETSKILNKIINIIEIAEGNKDISSFAQSIVDLLSTELHYTAAALLVHKDDELQVKAVTKTGDRNSLKLIPRSIFTKKTPINYQKPQSNLQKSVIENKVYHSTNLEDFIYPIVSKAVARNIQKLLKIKSIISVPCSTSHKVEGVLLIAHGRGKFSAKEELTLYTFSKQIGYILESRQLLAKSQNRKKSLMDILKNSFNGVIIADKERIHYVNPGMTQITEYSREELIKLQNPYNLAKSNQKGKIEGIVSTWLEERGPNKRFETIFISKSGEEVYVEVLLSKVVYQNKPMTMFTIRDITIHKKNIERLNKMNKRQAELFAEIAHSLKTPFTYINGLIELAMPTMKSQSNKDILDQITSEINYASDKISTLLQVAKYELKEHNINKDKVDSQQFIEAAYVKAKALGYHYCNADHTHDCECLTLSSNEHTTVNLDNQAIMDVIMTIIENAYEHAKIPGKELRVVMSSQVKRDQLVIEIADNGPGIPNYMKNKIFDRFNARVNYNYGHGIGLPMSKKIVEKHGGDIKVETKLNKGSKFIIQLPLHY